MVLLHVKRGDETQFYFETQTSMSVAELIPQLVHLNNQRLKLNHLMEECKDLLQYGPYKHPSEHGFTDEQLDQITSHQTPSAPQEIQVQGMTYLLTADPTGRRTGHAPMPAVRQQMEQTLSECHLQINASSSQQGWLTEETLEECRRLVHASVSIAYPMGLPDYDPITEMMESLPSSNKNKTDPQTEDMDAVWKGHAMSKGLLDAERCSLWWASKEWLPTKRVSDYLGTNEKTRVVVKLQKKGQGAPVREAPVDEQTQKEMMAYFYKKQQEHKLLMENNEEDYQSSPWADPKRLKNYFQGVGHVSWKPR